MDLRKLIREELAKLLNENNFRYIKDWGNTHSHEKGFLEDILSKYGLSKGYINFATDGTKPGGLMNGDSIQGFYILLGDSTVRLILDELFEKNNYSLQELKKYNFEELKKFYENIITTLNNNGWKFEYDAAALKRAFSILSFLNNNSKINLKGQNEYFPEGFLTTSSDDPGKIIYKAPSVKVDIGSGYKKFH